MMRLFSLMISFLVALAVSAQDPKTGAPVFQVRTNVLFDLAACPYVGLEVQLPSGFAFQADYAGAWWNRPSRDRYYSCYGFQCEGRYYLSASASGIPHAGHHLGVYGHLLTYDFEFGGTGYQCPRLSDTFGGGISYGYSIPLSRFFSLDLTCGLGYFQSRYNVYEPLRDRYLLTSVKRLRYVGPTKLEVSFVYNLNGHARR